MTTLSNVLLYTCTLQEVNAGIIPTTLLPHNHPFHHFLLNHLQTLTSRGKYDSVIDALIAVYIGDAKWRSRSSPKGIVTRRAAIRKLLIERTPKFAMVERNISNSYGFHRRTKVHENFIFVTKEYVDMLCGAENDSYRQLAMEALLKATVNHELAHWLFTQVRNLWEEEVKLILKLASWAFSPRFHRCYPKSRSTLEIITTASVGEYGKMYTERSKGRLGR